MISTSHPVSGDEFVNRLDLLSQLKRYYPSQNAALVGPRRIGKTSIAKQLIESMDQKDTIKFIFKVHENMGTPGKFAIRLLRFFLNAYFDLRPHVAASVIDEIEIKPDVLIDVANQIKSGKLYDLSRFLSNYYPPTPDSERAVMDRILRFLDDFSIQGDEEDMPNKLSLIFERCIEMGISLNLEKCVFGIKQGVLLGHVVSKDGVMIDEAKITKIKNLPISTNLSQLCGFLEHANYYKHFILNFASIVNPLTNLLRL